MVYVTRFDLALGILPYYVSTASYKVWPKSAHEQQSFISLRDANSPMVWRKFSFWHFLEKCGIHKIEIFGRNVLPLSRISMYRGTDQTSRYSFTSCKDHFKYLLQFLVDKRKTFFQTNCHQSLRVHNDCYPRPWGTLDHASDFVTSHPYRRHTPRSVRQNTVLSGYFKGLLPISITSYYVRSPLYSLYYFIMCIAPINKYLYDHALKIIFHNDNNDLFVQNK